MNNSPLPWRVRQSSPGKIGGHEVLDARGNLVCMMRHHPAKRAKALEDAKLIVAATNGESMQDSLRRALEVIAVGDSPDPVRDAGDELVALGFWDGDALADVRAHRSNDPTSVIDHLIESGKPYMLGSAVYGNYLLRETLTHFGDNSKLAKRIVAHLDAAEGK